MINPIQLTPNMDMATLTNAINDMMRQLESENRTQIIKDETGKQRIILGRSPKGEYLIAVSAQGIDVVEALG
jgi:hypothetical protein